MPVLIDCARLIDCAGLIDWLVWIDWLPPLPDRWLSRFQLPFFVDKVIPGGIVCPSDWCSFLILIFLTVSNAYLFSLIVSTSLRSNARPSWLLSHEKSHRGYFGNFNPAQHLISFGRWPQIQVERIGVGGWYLVSRQLSCWPSSCAL